MRRPQKTSRTMACVLMVVVAVLTACSSSSSQPTAKAFSSSQTQRFDELVQAAIGIHRLPGAVVSIDDPRRGTFAKAYGTADVVAGRKLQLNDRYRVYSVTKTFTATAILQLVDGGQLSLDDTLEKYVPGVPNGGLITIRELLAMRAGIYDYVTDKQLLDTYNANPLLPGWKPTDILPVLQRHAA
jgi:D-alanyl-D-alanine carboxypeptidase